MMFAEVIGDPISHSLSPIIHGYWIEQLGLTARYHATHVPAAGLSDYFTARDADPDWRGCNITLPHKVAALDHAADPGGIRSTIGAINCVFRQDGALVGTNTDAAGFFGPLIDYPLDGAHVALVGAGGAARAVLFALARARVAHVTCLARKPLAAMALLAQFGLKGACVAMDATLPPVDLLINCTPLGMQGYAPLMLDLDPLPDHALIYDLVYRPAETLLLHAAAARGLATLNGLDMLIGQAAVAFELFFNTAPPEDADQGLRTRLLSCG